MYIFELKYSWSTFLFPNTTKYSCLNFVIFPSSPEMLIPILMFNMFNNRDMDATYAAFPSDHYIQVPSTDRPKKHVCMHMNIFEHFVLIPPDLYNRNYNPKPHISMQSLFLSLERITLHFSCWFLS